MGPELLTQLFTWVSPSFACNNRLGRKLCAGDKHSSLFRSRTKDFENVFKTLNQMFQKIQLPLH
jgi:hypothetical protein